MKTQVTMLLKLNTETLHSFLQGRHGARLAYSCGNKAKVVDTTGGSYVVERNGRRYYYSIDDGRCLNKLTRAEARNYKYLRVQVTFRNIEEAQASPLFKYCVSRLKVNFSQSGIVAGSPANEHIYKKCEHPNNEIAKAGTYEEYAKWASEKDQQEAKRRTDGYLQYLNEFRGLYKDLADRQNTAMEIAIVAIGVSTVAALASIIALIVAVV